MPWNKFHFWYLLIQTVICIWTVVLLRLKLLYGVTFFLADEIMAIVP